MTNAPRGLYSFSSPLLNGEEVSLEEYRGRVLLIVNTASHCGFTPQYQGLEALYERYKDRGFSVLAFPSNQFGRQEPGHGAEIEQFCKRNYGVTFPVFQKTDVNGRNAHPLFGFLKGRRRGGLGWLTGGRILWNFTKFLCGRDGEVAARYGPAVVPDRLAPAIEDLLNRF
jgi:glutathione peroxidase